MQVETFECEEVAEQPVEVIEEAQGLVKKLGLEGQGRFYSPATEEKPSSFCSSHQSVEPYYSSRW